MSCTPLASPRRAKRRRIELPIVYHLSFIDLRNETPGFAYQCHRLLMEFTALENVAMPPLLRRLPAAAAVLDQVGPGHRLARSAAELSGRERQRAAQALATRRACVPADEPAGSSGVTPRRRCSR
jgi:predicted ABC-type transport system involved in lysophospholipase L1 biosynthesis ATPase subunit